MHLSVTRFVFRFTRLLCLLGVETQLITKILRGELWPGTLVRAGNWLLRRIKVWRRLWPEQDQLRLTAVLYEIEIIYDAFNSETLSGNYPCPGHAN